MFRHGVETAKTELVGDVLKRRGYALRPLPFQNEIQNLLLFSCQSNNTVYISSRLPVPGVKTDGDRNAVGSAAGVCVCRINGNLSNNSRIQGEVTR
jgi:hypothetical protein